MNSIKNLKYLGGGVVAFSLFHFMNHIYGLALPPIFPLLKDQFGIGNTELGLIASMISINMTIFQLPMGAYSDKIGRKKILSACLVLMIIATYLTSMASYFWMIVVSQILLGIGASGYHPVGISAVADLASEDKLGKIMSLQGIGGSLGVALAPIIVGGLASIYGWRSVLKLLAVAGIPLLIFIGIKMDETKQNDGKISRTFPTIVITLAIASFFFFRAFVFKSLTTFMPTYFVEIKEFSLILGGFSTSIFLLTGAIIQPFGGIAADRIDRVSILVFTNLISAIVLFVLIDFQLGKGAIYLLLILFGLFHSISIPASLSIIKEVSPGENYGRVFGMNFTTMALGGAISPLIIGYLGDKFSLNLAFRLLPIFLILSSISLFLIRKRIRENSASINMENDSL